MRTNIHYVTCVTSFWKALYSPEGFNIVTTVLMLLKVLEKVEEGLRLVNHLLILLADGGHRSGCLQEEAISCWKALIQHNQEVMQLLKSYFIMKRMILDNV